MIPSADKPLDFVLFHPSPIEENHCPSHRIRRSVQFSLKPTAIARPTPYLLIGLQTSCSGKASRAQNRIAQRISHHKQIQTYACQDDRKTYNPQAPLLLFLDISLYYNIFPTFTQEKCCFSGLTLL